MKLEFNKRFSLVLTLIALNPCIAVAGVDEYKFTIVLQSSSSEFKLNKTSLPAKYRGSLYKIYQSKVKLKNDRTAYRLKLGFFKNREAADELIKSVKKKYSLAWLNNIGEEDKSILNEWFSLINKRQAKKSLNPPKIGLRNPKILMDRAKSAIENQNYNLAISLYTKILNSKETEYHRLAQELLGVAREKNGQLIHARAEYKLYLKKYPDGEDFDRVNQRLLALNTVLLKPKKKLQKTKSKFTDWQQFGSFSQFYRSDTTTTVDVLNTNEVETSAATLSSVFNYVARKKTDTLHIKSQFTASHLYYFDNPVKKERGRINIAYIDIAAASNNKSIRIGRQSQNRAGVLGRMDGVWMEYRFAPSVKMNLVAGYPVNTTVSNTYQENKPFNGVSFDFTNTNKTLDFSVYKIEQEVDTITERSAIGSEIRYRNDIHNHFMLIDYDDYFDELNTFYFVGNWKFNKNTSLVATLNYRNSPILTTSNALLGQGTQTIESFLLSLPENEIKKIALERTARYSSGSLSLYSKLSDKWDFSGDITISKMDATPTTVASSPVVEVVGQESTGNEYFYNIQFLSNNLFSNDELIKYQVSYADTKTYNKIRYILSSSFKYNSVWRFRPRLTFEDRLSETGVRTQRFIPAFRIDHKLSRNFKWEFDASYGTSTEISTSTNPVEVRQNDLNLSLGFIYTF